MWAKVLKSPSVNSENVAVEAFPFSLSTSLELGGLTHFLRDCDPTLPLHGSYDPLLVGLSLLIAVSGSVMNLQLTGMVRIVGGALYLLAHDDIMPLHFVLGETPVGAGIDVMHYVNERFAETPSSVERPG